MSEYKKYHKITRNSVKVVELRETKNYLVDVDVVGVKYKKDANNRSGYVATKIDNDIWSENPHIGGCGLIKFLHAKRFYRFLFNVFYFIILLMLVQHLFYTVFVLLVVVLLVINAVWDYQDIMNRVDEEIK